MSPPIGNQTHGLTVKASYFCGFFLLISAAGTVGSAILLRHNENVARARWPEATGHVRNCWIASFNPLIRVGGIGSGKSYALLCGISYQLGGRTYNSALTSSMTRSLKVRARIADWIARNSPATDVTIRIDPAEPCHFFVQSPLPVHHGRDPDDFLYAAVAMGIAGGCLVAVGRRLARAGW